MQLLLPFTFLPFLLAQARTIPELPNRYTPPNANCIDYSIPVSVSTQGYNWTGPKWTNDFELTDFTSVMSSRKPLNPLGGMVDIEGNYSISATFCSPKTANGTASKVLMLTHGGGYDARYWNSGFEPETYNFVQFAISQGYSVFNYDRIGQGKSSKLSGFLVQSSIHIQVLNELATYVKNGQYTDKIGVPSKLVVVGHSMGSFYTNGLLAEAPEIADAAILTGLGLTNDIPAINEALNSRIAAQQDVIWADYDAGWTTWGSIYNNVNAFFKAPNYDKNAVQYADNVQAPSAIAEMGTLVKTNLNATEFKGPVLVINGEYDFLVCAGYCTDVIDMPATNFNGSSNFSTSIVPTAGHGLNFHLNAPDTYAAMTNFLKENGI